MTNTLLDMKHLNKGLVTAILSVLILAADASAVNYRSIVSVGTPQTDKQKPGVNIWIETPVGNAPQLPYQLWVTYSDGKGEFRQVKWQNSSEATEQAEANPTINPVGTIYKVRGFIIGDNSTPNGYPVWAEVKVVGSDKWKVISNKPVAEPLPLNDVSIDGKNRLTWNRDLDIDQLISLPVKQQLYNYRDTYGLSKEGSAQVIICRLWQWLLPVVRMRPRKTSCAKTSRRWSTNCANIRR